MKTEKKCTRCLEILPVVMFSRTNNDTTYRSKCRPCMVKYVQEYRDKLPTDVRKNREKIQNMTRRGKYNSNQEYRNRSKMACLEWGARNREKARLTTSKWRADNPVKTKEGKKRYVLNNSEKVAAAQIKFKENNREYLNKYYKDYCAKNFDKIRAHGANRRAKQLNCSPRWAKDLTAFVYCEAAKLVRQRKALTGIGWHIDHIIPLQGKNVTGLHVWNNFQVIPALENLRKKNLYRSI